MGKFFKNSAIYQWGRISRSNLLSALSRSRNARHLHHTVRKRVEASVAYRMWAANTHSRTLWGERICESFASFFCEGGDGSTHTRELLWVTLCDRQCVRARNQSLDENDLAHIKHRLRAALYGLNYVAIVEPAYYVNWQGGYGYAKTATCISWHLHAVVWGISRKLLNRRLRDCKRKGYYAKLASGLRPTKVKNVKQGGLPRIVAYMVKWPRAVYRVTKYAVVASLKSEDAARGRQVAYRFKQQPSGEMRPGDVITYLYLLANLRLDELTFAGGEGTALLLGVHRALDARDPAMATFRRQKYRRCRRRLA